MNLNELEIKIVDASDGVLNMDEIRQLEEELQQHPDLLTDYHAIMQLPDMDNMFPANNNKIVAGIDTIRKTIALHSPPETTFYDLSLNWFRHYALAASILIVGCTALLTVFQESDNTADYITTLNDLFYPEEISQGEDYVLYLEEFSDQ